MNFKNGPYFEQALLCFRQGDLETAALLVEMCLAEEVISENMLEKCGLLLSRLGKYNRAIEVFLRLIQMSQGNANLHYNLGLLYGINGEQHLALEQYNLALLLKENDPEILINKSAALNELGWYEQALDCAQLSLSLNNTYQEGWINQGVALAGLHRNREAITSYQEVLKINPNNAQARWNAALLQLLLGDYAEGFQNYEARWTKPNAEIYRHPHIPALENFDDLESKTLLVWAEQGYGDTLQFCRYLDDLKNLGANVVFECQTSLRGLMASMNISNTISIGDPIRNIDFQTPLLSLPRMFKSNLEGLSPKTAYLRANKDKVKFWESKLHLNSEKLNIGISCSGNLDNKKLLYRAASLSNFLPLLKFANLFLIQKDLRQEDIEILDSNTGIQFLGDQLIDFEDSAAVVECMDYVVSIDTSLVHLAGALGKEAWVALNVYPDWRWGPFAADTPWYPTAKLFRQKVLGDWSSVFQEIVNKLQSAVSNNQA